MAVGFPAKVSYLNGDVFSASDINDTNGTLNLLGASVAYSAGKNKFINGDFFINQRGFTSNTTNGSYNFDRFYQSNIGGTFTLTPQSFTAGTAPVSGYEGKTYLQAITASQSAAGDLAAVGQKIENVRNFAGQTATISFWAKATSGTPKIGVECLQDFGSGGSSMVSTPAGAVTLSTSWARYTLTVAIPSISGKTISTGNDTNVNVVFWVSAGSTYATRASSIGIQNNTFHIWGTQIEQGSTATSFQTASGYQGGELLLCQRYYEKTYNQLVAPGTNTESGLTGNAITSSADSTTYFMIFQPFKVVKRGTPTVTLYDAPGNSGKVRKYSVGATGTDNITGNADTISETSFRCYIVSTSAGGFVFHYVASAEL